MTPETWRQDIPWKYGPLTSGELYGDPKLRKSIRRLMADIAAFRRSVTVRAAYAFGDWPPVPR